MTRTIQLAPDLKLPLDCVLAKKAILAKTGAGKSNTAAAMVEETLDAKVPVIILDPKGDWWGLKSSSDGKSEGYPILILGGDHGDLPLDPASGKMVADYLVEGNISAIVDVSDFNKRQLYEFCGDFLTAFYAAKKKAPGAVLLVIEEADEVAPQKLTNAYGPALPICLGAAEKVVKRGRFLGIGTLVVTQRSASLNKDVLTQTDILILQRTTAPQDVDAVEAWIEHHPDQEKRKEVLESIQGLKNGEAFVWWPEHGLFTRTQFRLRRTFDSGRTPKIGETKVEPKVLAKADLEALRGRMAELVEKAKADDPKALRARIAELERTLDAKVEVVADEIERPVPTWTPDMEAALGSFQNLLGEHVKEVSAHFRERMMSLAGGSPGCLTCGRKADVGANGRCIECNGYMRLTPGKALGQQEVVPLGPGDWTQQTVKVDWRTMKEMEVGPRTVHRALPAPVRHGKTLAAQEVLRSIKPTSDLGGPEQRILDALAWLEAVGVNEPDKVAVAFIAGYRPGGGAFQNPLGRLRNADGKHPWPALIEYTGSGCVRLTQEGRRKANRPQAPPTTRALHEMVLGRLDGPEQRILQPLLKAYPKPIDKSTLAQQAGYAEGGGAFQNPLGRLRTLGLVDYPAKGQVRAEDILFPR